MPRHTTPCLPLYGKPPIMIDHTLFPADYHGSRKRFLAQLPFIREGWPRAQHHSHPLTVDSSLSIDWIAAPPQGAPERCLVFTAAEHGIEGYVGAAMLQYFIRHFLPQLDPATTGLVLVHAINPWGMANRRRTNPQNVDLNRNFVFDEDDLNPDFNSGYALLHDFLMPSYKLKSLWLEKTQFLGRLASVLGKYGGQTLKNATLMGQYRFKHGIYYGGNGIQEETQVLQALFDEALRSCPRLLHLDMHTGYGPRYQMSLVFPQEEPRAADHLASIYNYPVVLKTDPDAFYVIVGDMTAYLYRRSVQFSSPPAVVSTTFEFGTYGDSLSAIIRSLRAMIFENQVYFHGAGDDRIRKQVQDDFDELFEPSEPTWREKALADAHLAFAGILHAEQFV